MSLMKNFRFNIILKAESEGGFTVIVPSLPGCVTYGKNLKEAKVMAHDAIRGYIISLKKHGDKILSDNNDFITTIDIPEMASRKTAYA
jgi:predicted RNase H-like HicB family nuclease